jgi:hypothetical protein
MRVGSSGNRVRGHDLPGRVEDVRVPGIDADTHRALVSIMTSLHPREAGARSGVRKLGFGKSVFPDQKRARSYAREALDIDNVVQDELTHVRGGWTIAKVLVLLYRAEGDADWTTISEIIGEMLFDVVVKAEAQERRRP